MANELTRFFGSAKLAIKKHSPEILLAGGIAAGVSAIVVACIRTPKATKAIEQHKKNIEKVKYATEHPDEYEGGYTEEDKRNDTIHYFAETGKELAKAYWPVIALEAISVASLIGSHKIQVNRTAAVAAAFAASDAAFKDYRKNVIDKFGDEVDREMRTKKIAKSDTKTTATDKDGNVIEAEVLDKDAKKLAPSEFSRVFDETNGAWRKDPELNKRFLIAQQNQANTILQMKGYLFLNEVYDMLGFTKSPSGQVVGWTYNKDHQPTIDFGIFNLNNPKAVEFVNLKERSIILDFNVDGNILTKIGEEFE